MSTKDALLGALKTDPSLTSRQLAERFSISRQRVLQVLADTGVKPARGGGGPRGRGPSRAPVGSNAPSRAYPAAWSNGLNSKEKFSASFVGAALELIAAADLMRRGFHVYRALASTCPADMIAQREEKLLRVEVRSARRQLNGALSYSQPEKGRYDVLALVDKEGVVVYKPETPGLS